MAQISPRQTTTGIAGLDETLHGGRAPDCPEGQRALEALQESERRYRALLEGLDAIVWQVDLPETLSPHEHTSVLPFSFVSQQAEAILGYPVEQWLAEPDFWINHIHADDRERMLAHCRSAAHEPREHEMEYRMLAANGRLVWVCDRVRLVHDADGRPRQMHGLIEDITERKQAEETLRASEERFRALVENASDGIVLLARDGTILYVSPINRRVFGRHPGEVLGSTWVERVHPCDLERCKAQFLNAIEHPTELVAAEVRVRATDGSWRWVEGTARNLLDVPGVRAVVVNSRDITERKQAQAQLAYHAHLLANVSDAVIATDERFALTAWNRAAEEMYGWKAEEVLGRHVQGVTRTDFTGSRGAEALRMLAETGHGRSEVVQYRKDGEPIDVEGTTMALRAEDGRITGYVSVNRDITERKQAEKELNRSREEFRALSARLQRVREEERTRIAREIHDELGQTLTGLKMDLAWLQKRLGRARLPVKTREKVGSMLHLIDTTIQAVRKICSDLRPALLDDLGLAAAIEWQAAEFQARTGIRCTFTSSPDSAAPDVVIDRDLSTELFRILQESLTNVARHAHATHVRIALWQGAGDLMLEVADDGRGIAEAERLDPNALGLLGMRERARRLGGQVTIVGAPARGTTVTVCIPLALPERP